jgi:hypothetical protein
LGKASEVAPPTPVPFQCFAGEGTFFFFEVFRLQFADETGARGTDNLQFFYAGYELQIESSKGEYSPAGVSAIPS